MKRLRCNSLFAAAVIATFASCAAQAGEPSGTIANNESIFVDGRTFTVTPGKATGDAAAQIKKLGARDMGPGAIIFRSGDKLFVVDAPLTILRNGSPDGQSIYVGANPARTNRISIEYGPAKTPENQKLLDRLKEHRVLEVLQQMFSPFRLPVDLTIKTRECGMVNAWYSRQGSDRAVNLCYEYLQAIMANVPPETTAAGITPTDALIGQFFYVVVHELGHAVFDIYETPLFGREEDAADQFAAFIMVQFEKERARKLVSGAAYSFKKHMAAFKNKPSVTVPLTAFSSTHGQPEERFYNLLCTAYGSDTQTFAFLVDDEYLPKTRAPNCQREYYLLYKAMKRELSPHVDQDMANKVFETKWIAQLRATQ